MGLDVKVTKDKIAAGKTALGIEFGSTRIKAVLTDEDNQVIAIGNYDWENQLDGHIWTYSLDAIWAGLQGCYADLTARVKAEYNTDVETIGAIGFSGMMHGYMAFDAQGELLVPFRTWRNTITQEASGKLTELFGYHIPQRWSIAHLYQAILNEEEHVKDVAFFTTLAGYIHWKLSGEKVLGVGEASGMFPIDIATKQFNTRMIAQFDELVADKNYGWKLADILPGVLVAGEQAGTLTEQGAALLDVSGKLKGGIPMWPPEGDAGTGMVATNSVAVRTGNVSAGTSIFAMVVLEQALKQVHTEIDMVTTPSGEPVAMVHCNNCTSDINAWVNLFGEFADYMGFSVDTGTLFTKLFQKAEEGAADCGGLLSYNYFSGEGVTALDAGRPLFVRKPDAAFNLANFMRTHLYSALATLKIGLDILQQEQVQVDKMYGHGGFFTTKGVGQRITAAAMNAPVSVMETAGEGGAWGIALLADFMVHKQEGQSLAQYLEDYVFAGNEGTTIAPDPEIVQGFEQFMESYRGGLQIEETSLHW